MGENDIGQADYGDMKGTEDTFNVPTVDTDAASESKETEYINSEWSQQLGYYKKIPELKAAIDAKATWTVGKGYVTVETTDMLLGTIRGHGRDTFNTILENMIRTYHIGGDAFAEIIRDDEGILVNIKPLDPGVMKIIANRQGLIVRYEQVSKHKTPDKKFKKEDILHLTRNRVADELHGESLIDALKEIIDSRNEAMATQRVLMRRFTKPLLILHVDTDDPVEIEAFKIKADKAFTQGENLIVPKDAVVPELVTISNNSLLNLTPVINSLNQSFFQATGVPQIIVGGAQEITEASAKIAYLAFEQTIEEEQLYIEESILAQLNLEIDLEFPASLENELLNDKAKGETMQASTPEDTNVQGVGLNG